MRLLPVFLIVITCAFTASCGGDGGGKGDTPPTAVAQPLPLPGPYEVACSNIEQDFARLGSGEDAKDYWEGTPWPDGTPRYVTDLLADPGNVLTAAVTAPRLPRLYGDFAGQTVEYVIVVFYPTSRGNPRPDYVLPTGDVLPHMQTRNDPPLFPDDSAYPVVAFSHGLNNSPISSEDYISALSIVASYGYVVIAPFHGDPRFLDLATDDLGDALGVALNLDNFTALQALRPLTISAALTLVLGHPQWQRHLDATRIGGFGVSMGGETMMLLGGAGLTTSYLDMGLSWERITRDERLKAAVGYIPYFGQPVLPAFGHFQEGLDGIDLPFLGISGTADTVAPILLTRAGMTRLAGRRILVALEGVQHEFDETSRDDIFTWILTFLDAEVQGGTDAIRRLSSMERVAGGGDDSVWLD